MKKRKARSKDISNRAVLIMLVIVIIVSILSLAVYLNVLKNVNERQAQYNAAELAGNAQENPIKFANRAQGFVSLEILPPEESSEK